MKLVVDWGIRQTEAHFEVAGKDAKSARAFLVERGEWARFEGIVTEPRANAIVTNAEGVVTKVTLAPWYRIQMPRWRGYTTQRQPVKESWDVMWRALKDHESGHLDIFMRGFQAITRSLEEAEGLEGGEVKRQLEQATAAIQEDHDQYDTKTEHGQATGVVWDL